VDFPQVRCQIAGENSDRGLSATLQATGAAVARLVSDRAQKPPSRQDTDTYSDPLAVRIEHFPKWILASSQKILAALPTWQPGLAGILTCMNTTASEGDASQAFVARNEISASCEFNRQRTRKGVQRALADRQRSATPIPGIEVTYIEVDAEDWKQLVAA